MRRPDLLILIAIWQFLNALFCAIGIAAIALFAFPKAGPADIGTIFGLSIAIFFLLAFIGLSIAGGIGLLMGKNWGRIISIVNAALNLLNIPIGTIIGVLVLIYLTKSEVRDYFEGNR
ncbi:MAG: hypothetical protein JSW30_05195 [Dehalococcoidia bacterium]|nr:MAG: hypothetical protein JSW30_05195 [Dehalococcoidia bacterium]